MSNPYPSRRQLRLQREREERARLRDEKAQRWAHEVAQRQQRQGNDAQPVDRAGVATELPEAGDKRAVATPVDASAGVDPPSVSGAPGTRRGRRRVDSKVTSTGMLPIISKVQEQGSAQQPRSRRKMRELEVRRVAERRAEVARLQRLQEQAESPRRIRRATSPQFTLPTPPAQKTTSDELAFAGSFEEFAAEITDMSALETVEIRRAELRAEAEQLTQEIIELGNADPNVVDPVLLERQKELAEKSHELQKLETGFIETIDTEAPAAAPTESEKLTTATDDTPGADESQPHSDSATGPLITGPINVADDPDQLAPTARAATGTALATTTVAQTRAPKIESATPLDATEAHGLDSIVPKEFEAPERRIVGSSLLVFGIGIIALITVIILLTR